MKLFRYRRPSLKALLGMTKAKKRIQKELGITGMASSKGIERLTAPSQSACIGEKKGKL